MKSTILRLGAFTFVADNNHIVIETPRGEGSLPRSMALELQRWLVDYLSVTHRVKPVTRPDGSPIYPVNVIEQGDQT